MNFVIPSHQLNRAYRIACGQQFPNEMDIDDYFNMFDGCAFE